MDEEPSQQWDHPYFRRIDFESIAFLTEIVLDSERTAPSSSAVIAECEQVVANLEDNEYLSLWKMWTHMAEDTTLCDHRILAYIILNTDINEVTVFLREQRRLELQSQETLLSVSIHLGPAYDEQNSNFVESEYQRRRSHWIQRWIYSRADDFVCVLTAYVVAKKTFLSAFNAWLDCQRSRSSMEPIIQVFKCALKKKDDCADYALWLHSHLHSPNPVLALQMFHEACEIEWLFFDGFLPHNFWESRKLDLTFYLRNHLRLIMRDLETSLA